MNSMTNLSVFLVLPGTLCMLAAIVLSRRINLIMPGAMRARWRAITGLMLFFLAGYVAYMVFKLTAVSFPLEMVTGSVFLGGALFVLLVMTQTRVTILKVMESERRVGQVNQTLVAKNLELEHEIVARRQAELQAGARLKRMETLHAVDLIITSSLDLTGTMKVFLDQILPRLDVDAAAVLLCNKYTQTLEFLAARGFRADTIKRSREHLGTGSAGVAAKERRLVRIPDLKGTDNLFRRAELIRGEDFVDYLAVPLVAKGQVQGVLEIYHRGGLEKEEEWFDFLDAVAVQAAIAIDNVTLFNDLQLSNTELILAYDTTIEGWARALELRDKETVGHTQRVTEMTVRLAAALGISGERLAQVRRGAILHDIGKMGISDSILLKEGPLTEEEQRIMRQHPADAFELLYPIAYLRPALDIPYCHHEKWDGSGYPRRLAGESIPLAARIFSIVDVWDALVSERRYHAAWSHAKVVAHIRSLSGSHFDPELVPIFLDLVADEGE